MAKPLLKPRLAFQLFARPGPRFVPGAVKTVAANLVTANTLLIAFSIMSALLPPSYEFGGALIITFLVTILNIVGCGFMARSMGKGISIMGFFVFFMALFYGVRGLSYAIYEDDGLAVKLGVTDTVYFFAQGLTWVNVFLALTCATYAACAQRQVKPWQLMVKLMSKLVPPRQETTAPARTRSGLIVLVGGIALVLFFLFLGRTAIAAGQFSITAPFSYGFALAGLAGLVSIRSRGAWWFRFAVAMVFFVFATYFTRGEYSSRVYAVGLPALAIGFLMAHYRLYSLAMIGLICVLPVVQGLGESRYTAANEAVSAVAAATVEKAALGPIDFLLQPYTETSGDFTALDVFASVLNGEQSFRPWGLSLPYALVHWVPRQVWPGKPEGGILTDEASFRLARVAFDSRAELIPYDPGVVGNLYLEGSFPFIILGAILFGVVGWQIEIALQYLLARPTWLEHGYALYSIMLVSAFFAVRFRPYQLIYLVAFLVVGYYFGAKAVRSVERMRL